MMACGPGREPGTVNISMGSKRNPRIFAALTFDRDSALKLAAWLRHAVGEDLDGGN